MLHLTTQPFFQQNAPERLNIFCPLFNFSFNSCHWLKKNWHCKQLLVIMVLT